jgi:hypothetical protein
MADFPRATRNSRVGSNLKGHKKLAAAEAARFAKRLEPLDRAERQFRRQQRKILTKPVVRNASAIVRPHQEALTQAFMTADGSGIKIQQARRRARRSVDDAFRASIPRFGELEALKRRSARDFQDLVTTHLPPPRGTALDFELGEIPLPGGVAFQHFSPPYQLFEVTPVVPRSPDNTSFAQPITGVVATDVQFRHDEFSPDFLPGLPFIPALAVEFRSSVGVNFRVPQTGLLTIVAEMQNQFNQFVFSVTDNFGFSDANLDAVHSIFINLVRSGESTPFEQTLFKNGLVAHGEDLSFSSSPIQRATPFSLSVTPRDAFLKGEQIQVLAGAAAALRIKVNDMNGLISAVTLWEVKKLSIGIRV